VCWSGAPASSISPPCALRAASPTGPAATAIPFWYGHNVETLSVIADRLAQPEDCWRPFQR